MRVHAMGLDAAGPYDVDALTLSVTEGSPVRARLVCVDDATRAIEAFLGGGLDDVPDVPTLAEARVDEGPPTELRVEGERRCDVVLLTQVVRDGEAAAIVSYAEPPPPMEAYVEGCASDPAR